MLTARDLSEIELQEDEVVFAAVVDGVGGLLAAASPEQLTAATASIADALRAASIELEMIPEAGHAATIKTPREVLEALAHLSGFVGEK